VEQLRNIVRARRDHHVVRLKAEGGVVALVDAFHRKEAEPLALGGTIAVTMRLRVYGQLFIQHVAPQVLEVFLAGGFLVGRDQGKSGQLHVDRGGEEGHVDRPFADGLGHGALVEQCDVQAVVLECAPAAIPRGRFRRSARQMVRVLWRHSRIARRPQAHSSRVESSHSSLFHYAIEVRSFAEVWQPIPRTISAAGAHSSADGIARSSYCISFRLPGEAEQFR